MKFLCVSCNAQMKLVRTPSAIAPDLQGSLLIRFECPECLTEIAMLTNPFETQLVTSLGVEIGGQTVSRSVKTVTEDHPSMSQCPFSQTARQALAEASGLLRTAKEGQIAWTAQALVRLQNIPEFVRPMAKQGIEQFAKDHGFAQVNEQCLDAAKEAFGM